MIKFRSIRLEEFCKKVVTRPRPANLLKKRLWHRCSPVNFAKFLRTPFFTEHLLANASADIEIYVKLVTRFRTKGKLQSN